MNIIDVMTSHLLPIHIATLISTVGIVSLQVLAINYHRCVIQGTTVAIVSIVVG